MAVGKEKTDPSSHPPPHPVMLTAGAARDVSVVSDPTFVARASRDSTVAPRAVRRTLAEDAVLGGAKFTPIDVQSGFPVGHLPDSLFKSTDTEEARYFFPPVKKNIGSAVTCVFASSRGLNSAQSKHCMAWMKHNVGAFKHLRATLTKGKKKVSDSVPGHFEARKRKRGIERPPVVAYRKWENNLVFMPALIDTGSTSGLMTTCAWHK